MNGRNLQKEELDRIGRKLLDAARARNEEIEQIVGSPLLFDAIKTRIESERREQNSKIVSGGWRNFQTWNWQTASAMILLLFIVGVVGLIGFNKFFTEQQSEQAAAPKTEPKVEQIEIQPSATTPISEDSPVTVKVKNFVVQSPKIAEQKVISDNKSKARKSAAEKSKRRQNFHLKQNESVGEFYALASVGKPIETGEELRIVRAELSRSSLFALGVNLPIENESERIKTDLLVGADGVARAIRLIN